MTTYDGRAWLAASHDKYDVIMVDAYQDITIPFQMSSTEFFTMVREHLNPGGVMVVNMNMISDGQGSINEALSDTIASVFGNGNTLTADVPNTTNRELFAKKPVPAPKRTPCSRPPRRSTCVRPPTSAPAAKISNGIWKRSPLDSGR